MSKKLVSALVSSAMVLSCVGCVVFAEEESDLKAGYTVTEASEADRSGEYGEAYTEAGYKVRFVYENADENIESVAVVGDFQFYEADKIRTYMEESDGDYPGLDGYNVTTISGSPEAVTYSNYEYRKGMFPSSYDVKAGDLVRFGVGDGEERTDLNIIGMYVGYEMEEVSEGVYTVEMPVPAGQWFYKYNVTYTDGTTEEIMDPVNLPVSNDGSDCGWSLFYSGDGEQALQNMTEIFPRTDEQTGEHFFVTYTAIDGSEQPLEVYLPYGYDETQSYKVIYLSHGGGGNEVEWMSLGSAANIMDNLVASGETEPAVIVTMDNAYIWKAYDRDVSYVRKNLEECIVPFIEENYAVSNQWEDRAVVGLSFGGRSMSHAMIENPEFAKYGGFFSGYEIKIPVEEWDIEALSNNVIYMASGNIDFAIGYYGQDASTDERQAFTLAEFKEIFDEAGLDYTYEIHQGAHDWNVWKQCLTAFLRDIAWK